MTKHLFTFVATNGVELSAERLSDSKASVKLTITYGDLSAEATSYYSNNRPNYKALKRAARKLSFLKGCDEYVAEDAWFVGQWCDYANEDYQYMLHRQHLYSEDGSHSDYDEFGADLARAVIDTYGVDCSAHIFNAMYELSCLLSGLDPDA